MVKVLSGMFFGLMLIGFCADVAASPELQTEITEKDLQIINKLVRIAQKNSHQVRKAKHAIGFNAFVDILSIELSPSYGRTSYNISDFPSESERSFYISLNIDPIKVFTAIDKIPVMKAHLREVKQQTRLKVMKQYLAYLQAHQASKIAAYRMQKLRGSKHIASNISLANSSQLDSADYIAIATDVLNKDVQERLALEELAAVVGLSSQEVINILNRQD